MDKSTIQEKLKNSSADPEVKGYLLENLDGLNEVQVADLLAILVEEERLVEEAVAEQKSKAFKRLMGDMKVFTQKMLRSARSKVEENESAAGQKDLEKLEE